MPRYIDADKLIEMYDRLAKDEWNKKTSPPSWAEAFECIIADIDDQATADVVPKSEVDRLKIEIEALKIANDKMYSAIEETKAEVIEEYRQRVNAKMGKHTHLLGKEYVQRILREVEAELKKKYTEDEK